MSGVCRSFSYVFGSARVSRIIIEEFRLRGLEYIPLPPFSALDNPVADHADMLIFPHDGTLTVYESYYRENSELFARANTDITTVPDPVDAKYPYDIALNALSLGDKLFCLEKYTSHAVKKLFGNIINVPQGYSRCTVCRVDESTIITADPSIAVRARDCGIDVLEITGGEILLPGYSYGFIGGCSVRIGDEMLFCGDITAHPDFASIDAFLYSHGCTPVCMGDEILTDFGGFVII